MTMATPPPSIDYELRKRCTQQKEGKQTDASSEAKQKLFFFFNEEKNVLSLSIEETNYCLFPSLPKPNRTWPRSRSRFVSDLPCSFLRVITDCCLSFAFLSASKKIKTQSQTQAAMSSTKTSWSSLAAPVVRSAPRVARAAAPAAAPLCPRLASPSIRAASVRVNAVKEVREIVADSIFFFFVVVVVVDGARDVKRYR